MQFRSIPPVFIVTNGTAPDRAIPTAARFPGVTLTYGSAMGDDGPAYPMAVLVAAVERSECAALSGRE